MESYEYLDSQEFEDVIDFAIFVIEYFKNNYLIIRDFLFKDSPWDILISWKISAEHPEFINYDTFNDKGEKELSHEELVQKKIYLLSIIHTTYYNCVLASLSKNTEDGYVEGSEIDKKLYEMVADEKDQTTLMLKNDLFAIKILKFFIHAIEVKLGHSIKTNTYNRYKYELRDIHELWKKEFKKRDMDKIIKNYESNGLVEDEILIICFNKSISNQVREYISGIFRNEEEVYGFINYLFTLAYSYLIKMRESGEEIVEIEEDIIELVEGDENLTNIFFSNFNVASQILENVFDSMMEFGSKYDLSHEINDEDCKAIIRDLDEHYDDEFEPDCMLHTYSLDYDLRYIINRLLKQNDYTEFMSLLLDDREIYDLLFYTFLDARNSSFYKVEMIRKIIADVFEFLEYRLTLINNLEDRKHYEEIKNLKTDKASIINYFVNNYIYLLEKYSEYNECSDYFSEKTLFKNFKAGNIPKLDKLSLYSFHRYVNIVCGNLVELKSVDYLNNLLKSIKSSELFVIKNDAEINDKLFRLVCLNLYERLVTEQIIDETSKKNINEIIDFIEQTDDFSNLFISNPPLCMKILNLFLSLNTEDITNASEFMYRSKITDEKQIKVLKKLNKYEENN